MMFDPKQFDRGSDFRGDYPRQVNEELAFFAGRYLVRFLRDEKVASPKVLVARDGRLSSPSIYAAFIQGVTAEGATAIPCGLAPTDAVCWAAGGRQHGADAGVMITASHNPAEYNGIKIVRPKAGAKPGLEIIRPSNLKKYLQADTELSDAPLSRTRGRGAKDCRLPRVLGRGAEDCLTLRLRWASYATSFATLANGRLIAASSWVQS